VGERIGFAVLTSASVIRSLSVAVIRPDAALSRLVSYQQPCLANACTLLKELVFRNCNTGHLTLLPASESGGRPYPG
jgi:hypothetical protein